MTESEKNNIRIMELGQKIGAILLGEREDVAILSLILSLVAVHKRIGNHRLSLDEIIERIKYYDVEIHKRRFR